MKKITNLIYWSFVSLIFCFVSCHSSNADKENGWYRLDDHSEVAVGDPIVTVKDFAFLRLDSGIFRDNNEVIYEISGKVKQDKIKIYADETEKAIGKKIGFLYDGKVLCSPSPNMRIEGGHFSITLPGYTSAEVHSIYNALRKELWEDMDLNASLTSEEMQRFDSLYTAWRMNYHTNPITRLSSNTNAAKNLEQYPLLLEMGPRIIPLLITRLPVRSDFFALTLYDDLQDIDSLKCVDYSNGEQFRVQMTLKKYIEAKTGKKKREFASDEEKIKALKELITVYGWETDSLYTEEERDSVLLDMDYEIAEDLFRLFKEN